MPKILYGLSEIAPRYDAMLCDVWGVVHNGREAFAGAVAAMTRFRKERGPVILITNAPRPSHIIPPQLKRLGVGDDAWDAVVTSGDAVIEEISKRAPGPFFHLGPDKDDALKEGIDIKESDLEDAKFILCTGLFHDRRETPDDYRELLSKARDLNLPMVCANPDIVVKLGDSLIYCAGALAELYEALGGETIYAGKPHAPIYNVAFKKLAAAADAPISKPRILAIGDGLRTDVLGANKAGLDALFVAAGIHGEDARDDRGALSADKLDGVLIDNGLSVIGAIDHLAW